MNPQVTIAIPVFNRTTFFRQALESALRQTVPVAIIVVDNASDQADFPALLREYDGAAVSYFRNERNLGMGGNWNRCIDLCETQYLLILHDDDFLEPDYVATFLEHHEPDVALFFCDAAVVDIGGRPIGKSLGLDRWVYRDLAAWCFTNPVFAGAVFDVAVARRIGGFSTRLSYTIDWDFWFRVFLVSPTKLLPGHGANYRVYESPERGTIQLAGGTKTLRFNRNQFKRNFAHVRAWALYRDLRRAGMIPRPSLAVLVAASSGFNGRERRYWAAMCAAGPRGSARRAIACAMFSVFGPLLFSVLRAFRFSKKKDISW